MEGFVFLPFTVVFNLTDRGSHLKIPFEELNLKDNSSARKRGNWTPTFQCPSLFVGSSVFRFPYFSKYFNCMEMYW